MSDVEIAPLKTLEELLEFEKPLLCTVEPLRDVKRGKPDDPKILFCHDMMGGYLEDRFIHGCDKSDSYRFHHWHLIDSFVYFSHYMVTIPPPGWISAGHKHGVKVLGTFIVESDPGSKILNEIREGNLVSKVASQLALVAAAYKFDGWLINIESEMDKGCGPFLLEFLKAVTTETHRSVPGSLVIWYDSVLLDGKLDWQNELNEKNTCFFDLCDGIFLNYNWTEEMLQKSAGRAGSRKSDVYVGIDVFARKTNYTGGYETVKSVEVARKHGLSSAIFAAGWVYETQDKKEFTANQCRFWDFPEHCCPEWRVKTLPLCTSFCQGFGEKLFKAGEVVRPAAWFDLSRQQLQPRDQGRSLCDGCGVAEVCTEWAYNGGGCLLLRFTPDTTKPEASPYFRLFPCNIPFGSLSVSYTFQMYPGSSETLDVALVLMVRTAVGEKKKLLLGATVFMPEGEWCEATQDISSQSPPDAAKSCWQTRKFQVKDTNNVPNAVLEEIGISFLSFDALVASACLLGELFIERAADKTGNKSANNSCSDEGLISENCRQDASGQNSPGEMCPVSRGTTATGTIEGNSKDEPKVKELHECSHCGKAVKRRRDLTAHIRTHTGERPYCCDYCTNAYARKGDLVRHMQVTHTGDCPYSCDHCGSVFAKKFQLVKHMSVHTGGHPYSCDYCGRGFAVQTRMVIHMRTHTGERPYSCDHCGSAFKEKRVLVTHLRSHTGEKPHQCGLCPKAFAQSSALVSHLRTHTGERPFSCDHCGSTFKEKRSLAKHMITHTGEYPYSCSYCGHGFAMKGDMVIHTRRIHTGECPYSCEHCGSAFKDKYTLGVHLRSHTGERPYQCELCPMAFSASTYLKKHVRNHKRKKNNVV